MNKLIKRLSAGKIQGRPEDGRFDGFIDSFINNAINGWAVDRARAQQAADVVVVFCDEPIAILTADLHRPDLKVISFGQGNHGFQFSISSRLAANVAQLDAYAVAPELSRLLQIAVDEAYSGDFTAVVFSDFLRASGHPAFRLRRTPDAKGGLGEVRMSERLRPTKRLAKSATLIEIQDLILFLQDNTRVTGIQRVVSGLIDTTLSDLKDTARNVEFCTVDQRSGVFALWPKAELQALIEFILGGEADQSTIRAMMLSMQEKVSAYQPRAGDIFIISGAYWIVQGYGKHLLALRTLGVKVGAFIYDLIPLTSPQWVTSATRAAVENRAVEVFSIADFFLTISAFVKSELDQLLAWEFGGAKPSAAVPLPHELPTSNAGAITNTSVFPEQQAFVLCVCTLEGRKNHILLFRVWSALIRRYGSNRVPTLVLIGKMGWLIEEFRDAIEESNHLGGKIVIISGLADQDLSDLYRRCMLTVFPSFAEGWGLPVGESLAAGKLCVASRSSSIPEVGGNLVDYFDPHDYFDALRVINQAVFDEDYRRTREAAIASGFKARTWLDFSTAFHATVVELARQASTDGSDSAVPLLVPGHFYDLARLGVGQPTPWPIRHVKLALSDGWHTFEHWGAWSWKPRATISFLTTLLPGTAVKVWLRLVMPPGCGGQPVTIRGKKSEAVTTRAVLESPTILVFATAVSDGGRIVLFIERLAALRAARTHRDLLVGISGIAIQPTSDEAAESQILRYFSPELTSLAH